MQMVRRPPKAITAANVSMYAACSTLGHMLRKMHSWQCQVEKAMLQRVVDKQYAKWAAPSEVQRETAFSFQSQLLESCLPSTDMSNR